MSEVSNTLGAERQIDQALGKSQGGGDKGGSPTAIKEGIVTAVAANGQLTVEQYNRAGNVSETLVGLRPFGDISFQVGDKVGLKYDHALHRMPRVISIAGGGDVTAVPPHSHSSNSDGGFVANSVQN